MYYVTLGKFLISEPQFPHLCNGDDTRVYLINLLAQLNEILCIESA